MPEAYGPLVTDFYQVTMAYAGWKTGMGETEAAFALTFRANPFHGGYTVAAGLETAAQFLDNFHFADEQLDFLGSLRAPSGQPQFPKAFLDFLRSQSFRCTVRAVPEGTPVFPHEPVLVVEGPLWQCQWIETALLNAINFQSLIATKAARVAMVSRGKAVLEFGLRRAQGPDGALSASRAAYVGGVDATSNVEAARRFGIPLRGTQAHSWIMAFDDEQTAFEQFAEAFPDQCTLLVDTYSTPVGVERAIAVGKQLAAKGHRLAGIRLDSGDFAQLSQLARRQLDAAGFPDAQIAASNELDEHLIQSLFLQDAKIDQWGVGTKLVVASDQPALSGVYKLVAIRRDGVWIPRIKVSDQPEKTSNPGPLVPHRLVDDEGVLAGDLLCAEGESASDVDRLVDPVNPMRWKSVKKSWKREPLLKTIFDKGKRVGTLPPLEEIRAHRKTQMGRLPSTVLRLENPHRYPVGLSPRLAQTKAELVEARLHERENK